MKKQFSRKALVVGAVATIGEEALDAVLNDANRAIRLADIVKGLRKPRKLL